MTIARSLQRRPQFNANVLPSLVSLPSSFFRETAKDPPQLSPAPPPAASAQPLANPPNPPTFPNIHPQPTMHILLLPANNPIRLVMPLEQSVFLRTPITHQ